MSLLETERRAALRQHEDELAAEAQRLDDAAKEQRLRQVESMELAYQTQLQASPDAWTVVVLGCVAKIALCLGLPTLTTERQQKDRTTFRLLVLEVNRSKMR